MPKLADTLNRWLFVRHAWASTPLEFMVIKKGKLWND